MITSADNILRRSDVEKRTGLCRSSMYAAIDKGTFPKPIRLTPKAVGWLESEIVAWQAERIAARDKAA